MENVIEIKNPEELDKLIIENKPILIDFWASWCGPCKMIAPLIEELAREYTSKINICKVDVDENPEITAKYGIRSIPTLLVFNKGELVEKHAGAIPKSRIVDLFKNYLV